MITVTYIGKRLRPTTDDPGTVEPVYAVAVDISVPKLSEALYGDSNAETFTDVANALLAAVMDSVRKLEREYVH